MKNPRLLTSDNVPCALSNLYYGNNCSVMAICDVVEDSETAEDLMNGLNKLNLLKKFSIVTICIVNDLLQHIIQRSYK